jgi:hypothetical protein
VTPHEHYKRAEDLLEKSYDPNLGGPRRTELLHRAQVHATLASVVSWPTEER